jgi:4-hydroxyproline epimerase
LVVSSVDWRGFQISLVGVLLETDRSLLIVQMAPKVKVIDSHTGGEPTRLVVEGGPDLGQGSLAQRLERLRDEHDRFRSAVVNEPRGSDVIVGALLCEPSDATCVAGVIFFNNVGYLGMCGHGTIGLVVTLAHLGRIRPGRHRIETPVGVVGAELHKTGEVTITNVASYRVARSVKVEVDGYGCFVGDVAWGGNWFFLVNDHRLPVTLQNTEQLTDCAWKIREALTRQGITGGQGEEIDHVELFGEPVDSRAHSKNFVLCPGRAYDRSPCGTGTSAKMACLYADGKLKEGEIWLQEGILGSVFEGRVKVVEDKIFPSITGSAFVNSEATLIFDDADPFCYGIRV